MRSILLIISSALIVTAPAAHSDGDHYYTEITAGHTTLTDVPDENYHTSFLRGEFHFTPVNIHGKPRAEAAFLARSSNLSITAQHTEHEYCFHSPSGCAHTKAPAQSRLTQGTVDLELFFGDLPLYAGAQHTRAEHRFRPTPNKRYFGEANYWTSRLGFTPADGMLIYASLGERENLRDDANFHAKYVTPTVGLQSLNIELDYYRHEGENYLWVGRFDYYFTTNFSLGGSYDKHDNHSINGQYFLTSRAHLGFTYSANREDDGELWGVSAGVRF